MSFSRQTNTSELVSIGNANVTFSETEKVLQVWRLDSASNPTILTEVLLAEMRELAIQSSDKPTQWALVSTTSNGVTIRINATPATAYALYADVIAEVSDLSGSNEPAFPESFHDILIEGVLKDEYRKLEKIQLARDSEATFQRRMSDLRMFVAKSNYLDIQQGKLTSSATKTGAGGGTASLGTTALTITANWTFDRDPSAPFTVTASSTYVANLIADNVYFDASPRIMARYTAGAGNGEEATLNSTLEFSSGALQRAALTGDVTASAGSNTTTIAADAVTDTKLRNSGALSVIGRSANTTGDPADISATATSGAVLREASSVLGFGTIATAGIGDNQVTYAKVQDVAANSYLGRAASSSGDVSEVTLAASQLAGRGSSGDLAAITLGTGLSMSSATLNAAVNATIETTTLTGTQDNFDLDAAFTHLRCNNASALTFTGFTVVGSAPVAGNRLVIENVGSSTVRIADEDAGSTAANRIDTPSVRGQIIGAGGAITLLYDGTSSRWKMTSVEPGTPITVAYSAGDYTAQSGTWTVESGDLLGFRYIQRGKMVTFIVNIDNSSVSATPSDLDIALPNSFTGISFQQIHSAGRVVDNGGVHQGGIVALDASGTVIKVRRGDDANFSAATNNMDVAGNWTFEVS